jgi:hypothetical protein
VIFSSSLLSVYLTFVVVFSPSPVVARLGRSTACCFRLFHAHLSTTRASELWKLLHIKMDPATDEKVDLEQELLMNKSLPTYRLSQKLSPRAPKGKLAKMTARRIFFMLLAVTLLALGPVSATIGPGEILPRAASAISKAQRQFHDIFNNEGPATLLSHSASTVQSDIHGSTEPSSEIAYQKEVDAPKNLVELAKRQTGPGNETSTGPTSSPTSSSSTTSSSSSSSSSISSSSQTTTTSPTSSVPTTTSPTSTPTSTPPPTSTTTTTNPTSSPSTSSSPTSSTFASSTTKGTY